MMYVDTLDANKVIGVGIDAMLHSLDPYTEYYPEAKQKYELAAQAFIKGSWKEAKKSAMAAKILEALVELGI